MVRSASSLRPIQDPVRKRVGTASPNRCDSGIKQNRRAFAAVASNWRCRQGGSDCFARLASVAALPCRLLAPVSVSVCLGCVDMFLVGALRMLVIFAGISASDSTVIDFTKPVFRAPCPVPRAPCHAPRHGHGHGHGHGQIPGQQQAVWLGLNRPSSPRYRTCRGCGKGLCEVVIEEVGYTWSGQKPPLDFPKKTVKIISSNNLMWRFFEKHRLNPFPLRLKLGGRQREAAVLE